MNNRYTNPLHRNIYESTKIVRKPIIGIVSGYHELPYILVAPDKESTNGAVKITGTISVSPKFIITPSMLGDKFEEIFDSETFSNEIEGRFFTFPATQKNPHNIESKNFSIKKIDKNPDRVIDEAIDRIQASEELKTSVIYAPEIKFYPISIDKFISSILKREFNF